MLSHGNKRIIRYALIIVLIGGAIAWYNNFKEYPYCTIEHQDINTIKGTKPFWRYGLSKLITQRRELKGNDTYAMYIFVGDHDGIASIRLTIDGVTYPLNDFVPNTTVFETDIEGDKRFGLHKYMIDVVDRKGKKSHAEAYVKVSPLAGVGLGGGMI